VLPINSPARARRYAVASAVCAASAAVLLTVAIALNANALNVEDGIVSDEAFGPFLIGVILAIAVCALSARYAIQLSSRSATAVIVLSAAFSIAAVIGALLAIGEPSVFNAGYGCLGRDGDVWLAVAMRPTPAPCGYLIPAADESLFYPAASVASAAAALGAMAAVLMRIGRVRHPT
jgi:hypothetical protein